MSTFVSIHAQRNKLETVFATEPIVLEVTMRDLKASKKKDPRHCAFACAAERLPDVKAAFFFRTIAWLEYDEKIVGYRLPPSLQKEIVSFDRAGKFAPGTYQLSPMEPRKRRKRPRKRGEKNGKGHVRKPLLGIRHQTAGIRTLSGWQVER